MKKVVISICLCLLAALPVAAQGAYGRFSVIPRLGISISDASHEEFGYGAALDETVKSRAKAGLLAGVDVEYQAYEQWAFSVGMFYSMQGWRFPDVVQTSGSKQFGIKKNRSNMPYLNIPVMAHFYVAEGLAIKAGVQAGFLLGAKMKLESTELVRESNGSTTYLTTEKQESDFKDMCHNVDFAIPVGVSYEYKNVILDARYQIGLTSIYKMSGWKAKNEVVTISVGYRFQL